LAAKVPKTLEGRGQAMVDELKELNLRAKKDEGKPRLMGDKVA